jgi:hypothetical protein
VSEINPQDFGRLQAEVESLRRDLGNIGDNVLLLTQQVTEMRRMLDEARGGWKTLLLVGGAMAAIGAALSKGLAWLVSHSS